MPSNPWANLFAGRNAAMSGRGGAGGGIMADPKPFGGGTIPYGDLANQLNSFMNQQAVAPLNQNLPGYGANLAQQSSNTGSMLRGEVPADVLYQIQQRGAERGVSTGAPGSSNANAAWLQALGLTSIGLQQQGNQAFSKQQSDLRVPELWNPASLFVPEQLANQELMAAQSAGGGAPRQTTGIIQGGLGPTGYGTGSGFGSSFGYGRAGW